MGAFVYYNVVLTSTKVPGNPYLNYTISSASEIPAALLGLVVATRWSRRRSQATFLALAALTVVPTPFLTKDSPQWVSITCNVVQRFFILSAGFIKWIMVLEVFPTSARSFGFACCLTCSRCGAMVAPFLRDLVSFLIDHTTSEVIRREYTLSHTQRKIKLTYTFKRNGNLSFDKDHRL